MILYLQNKTDQLSNNSFRKHTINQGQYWCHFMTKQNISQNIWTFEGYSIVSMSQPLDKMWIAEIIQINGQLWKTYQKYYQKTLIICNCCH